MNKREVRGKPGTAPPLIEGPGKEEDESWHLQAGRQDPPEPEKECKRLRTRVHGP